MSTNDDTDSDDAALLDQLTDDEEVRAILEDVEMDVPGGERATLADVTADLVVAHKELDGYKNGALTLSQFLDEAIIEQETLGNAAAVGILRDLKKTAFGVYLRVKRGDDELLGERDGKFSGYYADDDPAAVVEADEAAEPEGQHITPEEWHARHGDDADEEADD